MALDRMVLLTACLLSLVIFPAKCLRLDGTLSSKESWEFLARFCFLSNKGSLRFEFEYPAEYKTQEVLLYFDEASQWESVYKKSMTCDQKVAVLNPANNQIIPLSTLYTWSGCKEVTENGVTKVKCTGGRTFRSSRERWWFIAISRCDPGTTGTIGLNLKYSLHMTNGKEDDILRHEFSADEFYILPIDISFAIVYVLVLGVSILFAYLLKQRQLFHTTYKMYMVSLGLWTFSLLLYSIAYGKYANTGYKETGMEYAARGFGTLSYLTFILMLILMAKGYTITRGRLTSASTIKVSVFFTLYFVTFVILFIYEALVFDAGEVLYLYESPPGYGLITMRLLGWAWFCYSVFFTLKHYKSKSMFYYPFFIFYTVWFWLGPIVSLSAAFAMEKWIRAKTVHSVDLLIELLSHLFFLVLTRPQAANKNFPYHVRTSQIGSLMGTGDNELDSYSAHPYAEDSLSRRTSIDSKGPDFSGLFITSNSRSTDRLVPNESFSEFPDSAIKVETAPPPTYNSAMNPRRHSENIVRRPSGAVLPPIRRNTMTSTSLVSETSEPSSPRKSSTAALFTIGEN
ncbi:transmembrane protein 145-like isoform X1 [Ostrea edulis]|uniref:transmembrane protein 145-like isoform X1 n=1 Tax=Ostrea edulis TaxID=37623 RepID=UPI0024AEB842|nr:transmembrane protein 145-like isoform X1 [Ostrea edulis]